MLDNGFAQRADDAPFPIDVIHGAELTRIRSMLLGETTLPMA